ncbi:hypothetical protein J2S42_000766 [Catenuloplanes indicus]|uniref:Uncharacterized protein n=1 Tax=Catenuloplanes indicus TaxID=137267 RepID=A0AAE4AVK1_9ACTN|nr:hypothetical protein [Catenuloplanes indicus]
MNAMFDPVTPIQMIYINRKLDKGPVRGFKALTAAIREAKVGRSWTLLGDTGDRAWGPV